MARPRLLQMSKELSSRRCANFNHSPLERSARRVQEARLPLGRGKVRKGNSGSSPSSPSSLAPQSVDTSPPLGTALHADTVASSHSRDQGQRGATRHKFDRLETQVGAARSGAALRPTSALRGDSHEETTTFRCADFNHSPLERSARRIQEARLPLGRGEVRTGGTIVLTIRRHAVDAPLSPRRILATGSGSGGGPTPMGSHPVRI